LEATCQVGVSAQQSHLQCDRLLEGADIAVSAECDNCLCIVGVAYDGHTHAVSVDPEASSEVVDEIHNVLPVIARLARGIQQNRQLDITLRTR